MAGLNLLRRRNQVPAWLLWLFGGSVLAFAVFILWANEGQINWADVARTSLRVDEAGHQAGASDSDSELIWVSGLVTTAQPLADPPYVRPQPWIQLSRTAEVYAWQEISSTQTTGGNPAGNASTTFRYEQVWTAQPQDSRGFIQPATHVNPTALLSPTLVLTATQLHFSGFTIDPSIGLDLPTATPLDAAAFAALTNTRIVTEYLYVNEANPNSPQIGDVRLHYTAVPAGRNATIFAARNGNQLRPYFHRGDRNVRLFRLFFADRETAIAQMQAEYTGLLWFTRFIGFFSMWLGLMAALWPISRLMDLLPLGSLLQRLGRAIHIVVSGVLAFVLSALIIGTSFVAHRPLMLVAVLVMLLAAFAVAVWLWIRWQRKRTKSNPAEVS